MLEISGGTSEKTGVQGGERGPQGPTEVLGKQTTEGEKVARCTPAWQPEGLKRRAAGTCATTSPRASSLVVRPWSLVSSRSSRRVRRRLRGGQRQGRQHPGQLGLDSRGAGRRRRGARGPGGPAAGRTEGGGRVLREEGMSEAQKEKLRREYLGLGAG